MKRFPAFDPPEYVDWRPTREVTDAFRDRLVRDPERKAILSTLQPSRHLKLYAGLVRNRLHDIALRRWVKQGIISKAWLGTGEEAVSIGTAQALEPGDYVGPMIRNAGACHEMGMPVADMLRAYLGTYDTLNRGRDLHTGDPERGVIPPISMVGALVPVFTGIALAVKQQGRTNVALTWVGEGATRTQDFHEGANFAAVQKVPAIFVIQNNLIALGTPPSAGVAGNLEELHKAYGVAGRSCDGNNVLDVYATARLAVDACRKGEGPVFIHAETFRMGGHATHDEAEARALFTPEEFQHWGRRDPIGSYETWLIESGPRLADGDEDLAQLVLKEAARSTRGRGRGTRPVGYVEENRRILQIVEERVTAEVEAAAAEALESRSTSPPPPESALDGVYSPVVRVERPRSVESS